MKKIINIFGILWSVLLVACGDFLEEYPRDLQYVNSISDLSELLVGDGYMISRETGQYEDEGETTIASWIHLMDDDVQLSSRPSYLGSMGNTLYLGYYEWLKLPSTSENGTVENDEVWSGLYEHIASLNVILDEVEAFQDAGADYHRVKGEALFLRATYYFWLVNLYAKPYAAGSAATDLGVPIKVSAEVEDKDFVRDPVEEVYGLMVEDLSKAISNLKGVVQPSVYRANESAARALLSRVYLYMGEWEKCDKQCDTIMQAAYRLQDLNALASGSSMLSSKSPETIFSMGEYRLNAMVGWNSKPTYAMSADLEDAFSNQANDLRYQFGIEINSYGNYPSKFKKWSDGGVSDCNLVRYAEVCLNKAEALAMLDDDKGAREVIHSFLATRYRTGGVPDIATKKGKDLVNFIRNERRLELCFEGHRWFDLRRYSVSPKYPETKPIRHEVRVKDSGIAYGYYELEAYPNGGWVLPIPTYELQFTDGNMVNNERPAPVYVEYE
ncbi:RagB/SusD family nutrient uptake outer membrane protein [Butyricimonas sp.]|uniref:RagB/SusD family nutrient uptake outer membrane protein n=1 Tax=Butyricimonas sp. TaxID=1969738 RepID=UPI0025BCE1B4|nr:RagB/SusD family nutrient uptake outer membrane protein [Butyricimonas sp.]